MDFMTDNRPEAIELDSEFHFLKEARYDAERTNHDEVYVDLSATKSINSEGLNDLIRLNGKVRQQGRQLVLENVSEQLMAVFHLTRLDRLFVVH